MNGAEWAVVIGGLALIGWINWYFFLASAGTSRPTSAARKGGSRDRTTRDV